MDESLDEVAFSDALESLDGDEAPAPPLSFRQLDQQQYHIRLQEIGERLQNAANAAYPNDRRTRYSNVYVLILLWEEEDPKLPVSIEAGMLHYILQKEYNYEVEIWEIPIGRAHTRLNQKILDFVELGDDSKEDLKIVYYGGHGMLAKNRQPSWASRSDPKDPKYQTVQWSGIQNALENCESDVLLLLDCCSSGTASTGNGRGTTELIAACSFNAIANPVGAHSFTTALVTELSLMKNLPSFTVGCLFNRILCRIQGWMPQGQEMQKSPLHVVLSQNERLPTSIQLSPRALQTQPGISSKTSGPLMEDTGSQSIASSSPPGSSDGNSSRVSVSTSQSSLISEEPQYPRIALNIRLKENLATSDLSVDLMAEWLRMMPLGAEHVKVEVGFASFSTLLIISVPIPLFCYLAYHPAVSMVGLIRSPNIVPSQPREPDHQPSGTILDTTISTHTAIKSRLRKQPPTLTEPREQERMPYSEIPDIMPIRIGRERQPCVAAPPALEVTAATGVNPPSENLYLQDIIARMTETEKREGKLYECVHGELTLRRFRSGTNILIRPHEFGHETRRSRNRPAQSASDVMSGHMSSPRVKYPRTSSPPATEYTGSEPISIDSGDSGYCSNSFGPPMIDLPPPQSVTQWTRRSSRPHAQSSDHSRCASGTDYREEFLKSSQIPLSEFNWSRRAERWDSYQGDNDFMMYSFEGDTVRTEGTGADAFTKDLMEIDTSGEEQSPN